MAITAKSTLVWQQIWEHVRNYLKFFDDAQHYKAAVRNGEPCGTVTDADWTAKGFKLEFTIGEEAHELFAQPNRAHPKFADVYFDGQLDAQARLLVSMDLIFGWPPIVGEFRFKDVLYQGERVVFDFECPQ